ncbi:MAG TPA: helicase associated domain-containing protein [Chthoniobacteraceae bacterium]|nr:helicase associated domain-containing protein [Chthoniobacteraceae bacterium]
MKPSPKLRKRKPVGWDDEAWELRFGELLAYKTKYGHTRVPARWRGNAPLGNWLAHQREWARAGTLEPDRKKRLEKLGVEWRIEEPQIEEHDLYTEKMLARLGKFRERHGHAGVTPSRDKVLHLWMARQRLGRKAGTLRKYRIARLTEAGFPWEAVDPLWEEKFVRLGRFKERFGHTRVPREWKEDKALGRWVEHQRARPRMGIMTDDHRQRLEELGFQWEIEETHVEEHDRLLEEMLARLRRTGSAMDTRG